MSTALDHGSGDCTQRAMPCALTDMSRRSVYSHAEYVQGFVGNGVHVDLCVAEMNAFPFYCYARTTSAHVHFTSSTA